MSEFWREDNNPGLAGDSFQFYNSVNTKGHYIRIDPVGGTQTPDLRYYLSAQDPRLMARVDRGPGLYPTVSVQRHEPGQYWQANWPTISYDLQGPNSINITSEHTTPNNQLWQVLLNYLTDSKSDNIPLRYVGAKSDTDRQGLKLGIKGGLEYGYLQFETPQGEWYLSGSGFLSRCAGLVSANLPHGRLPLAYLPEGKKLESAESLATDLLTLPAARVIPAIPASIFAATHEKHAKPLSPDSWLPGLFAWAGGILPALQMPRQNQPSAT